ncbi:MAG: hypothetical protein JWL85_1016 [Candidatus Saccharibacteria bacterium]|nr:hypothetical protein [Candidatus Saccharibacteria bacterium]
MITTVYRPEGLTNHGRIPPSYPERRAQEQEEARLREAGRERHLPMEADLRGYFDPTEQHTKVSLTECLDAVAEQRPAIEVQGLGKVAGHEVMALEAAATLLNMPQQVSALTKERKQEITDYAHNKADIMAAAVARATNEQIDEPYIMDGIRYFPRDPMVMVGKVVASVVHETATDNFFGHLEGAAAVASIAWHRRMGGEDSRERELHGIQLLSYLHHAPRGPMSPEVDVERYLMASPLVASRVLRLLGVEAPHIVGVTRALRCMPLAERVMEMDAYEAYLSRGRSVGAAFIINESSHLHYAANIAPVITIEKALKARQQAHAARERMAVGGHKLRRAADESLASSYAWTVHGIFGVEAQDVSISVLNEKSLNYRGVALAVRQYMQAA